MTGTTKILTILVCTALIVTCQIINWNLTDHLYKAFANGVAMGLAGFCAFSIAKAVWTTKLSSRMHAMYIIKLNLSARPTFDAAERHVALYKARMPWKRSEFNKQIVPGYIHPVPKLTYIRLTSSYEELDQVNSTSAFTGYLEEIDGDRLWAGPLDRLEDQAAYKMEILYAYRVEGKRMTKSFINYCLKESGYVIA